VHSFRDELTLSPSDLHNFLECRHLTQLELAVVKGEIDTPDGKRDASADLIARKGDEHEARFLRSLKDAGKEIVEIPATREPDEAAAATVVAMKQGVEVIYQSAFIQEPENGTPAWTGYADFLFRVETPSNLGDYSYEVADTKLARRTKPYFLLQLCFYSEQVARIQRILPEYMHVVLGTNEQHRYRVAEFISYYRSIRDQFVAEIAASPLDTFPMPVDHCGLCRWSDRCDAQRVEVDHLSLVAGMRRDQILRLTDAGIETLAELGEAADESPTPRIPQHSYDRLHHQARLQLDHRTTGKHSFELLEPAKRRGLAMLPPPDQGDLFFDMEGDPLYENGLEYLFGAITNDTGEPVFHPFWGTDREKEKLAFEVFIDFVVDQRKRYPEMHVYHYAQYEVTALKRLMGLHGTREEEVDDLLRNEVFVDLYKVVRQGMRISQPSYSIKKVEVFYMDERDAAVTDGEDSIVAYEQYLKTGDPLILDAIAAYNEEDCLSTLKLRDWLLERRAEAEREYGPAETWQEPEGYEPDEKRLAEDAEVESVQRALVAGLPEDIAERTHAERARALMADLLAYHRREDKPAYWQLFARRDMTPDELEEDPEALGNLTRVDGVEAVEDGKSSVYEMSFPPQEHRLKADSTFEDPAIKRGLYVADIDNAHGRIWVKRGTDRAGEELPRALIPDGPIRNDAQRAALRRVGGSIVRDGLEGDGPYRALHDVLARELPRIAGHDRGEVLQPGAYDLEHAKDLASGLDRSYLFIQGPPGSGKTYSGARLILHLIAQGMRVGVTSQSHSAIHELLAAVEEAAGEDYPQLEFHGLHKASDEDSKYDGTYITSSTSNAAVAGSDAELKSGTAWLFSREEMDSTLDYLFIDEAGQFALADAIAVGTAARNLVLLGDPLQLPQVTQGRHPEGSDASVLEHLLGENPTVRPERGLFIDKTRRMHPDVTSFISEVVYAGRLGAIDECSQRGFRSEGNLTGTGIRYLPVEHEGNSRCSNEEAAVIADAVREMLKDGRYTDEEGTEHELLEDDVMVLSPYNAQVQVLGEHLPEGVRIGTVDKFQGREAPVVFFSMATSTGAELPRNLEFLFSRNRLNVAISRAQCLAVLVASPQLLQIQCRMVDQMLLVNALCRLVEVAKGEKGAIPVADLGAKDKEGAEAR
jgi:predicted RecB family nuclease